MLLEVSDIYTSYGKASVLFGVSIDVKEEECVGLFGRNGMGKTTLFRSIMGSTPPNSGTITYMDEDITGLSPQEVVERGIVWVPEDRAVFSKLSVEENLKIGELGAGKEDRERVLKIFPILEERLEQMGGTLSGGEQQILTLGRALTAKPKLLLLDEPFEGLAPEPKQKVRESIREIKEEGISIIIAGQRIGDISPLLDRSFIIEEGNIKFSGTMEEALEAKAIEKYVKV